MKNLAQKISEESIPISGSFPNLGTLLDNAHGEKKVVNNSRILVVTDNERCRGLATELYETHGNIEIRQSPKGSLRGVQPINVATELESIVANYSLVMSMHCKQMFPAVLVNRVRCVNVHPGLNPHNRGWYPQVFSIINGLPCGVTIHEMDEELDHGPIIVQRELKIQPWDTSETAYDKLMRIERELVLEHFVSIRENNYQAFPSPTEGNVNYRKHFDLIRQIDLEERGTFGQLIDRLRALTHGEFRNAFFLDSMGRKVFVKLKLEPEADLNENGTI